MDSIAGGCGKCAMGSGNASPATDNDGPGRTVCKDGEGGGRSEGGEQRGGGKGLANRIQRGFRSQRCGGEEARRRAMNAIFSRRDDSLHMRTVLYARPDAPSTARCQRQAALNPTGRAVAARHPLCYRDRGASTAAAHAGRVSFPAVLGAVWKHATATPPPPPRSGLRAWRRMAAVQWHAARARRAGKTYEARQRPSVWSLLRRRGRAPSQALVEPGPRGRPAHLPLLRSRCADGNGRPRGGRESKRGCAACADWNGCKNTAVAAGVGGAGVGATTGQAISKERWRQHT